MTHITNHSIDMTIKCWLLTLRNGIQIGFHDHDTDITIDGTIYHAHSCEISAMAQGMYNHKEAFEFQGILSHDKIKLKDVMEGLYDDATIEVFMLDLLNKKRKIWHKKGFIREIAIRNNKITANVYDLSAFLECKVGDLYAENCRATFGDYRCRARDIFSIEAYIENVLTAQSFVIDQQIDDPNIYANGSVSFTTANTAVKSGIYMIKHKTIEVIMPLSITLCKGDKIIISSGCDKRFTTCSETYNNAINFRGEPHIPCYQKLL